MIVVQALPASLRSHSVVVSAAVRRYLVMTTTVVGKLLSRTRCLAKALAATEAKLASHEQELKTAVQATLCLPVTASAILKEPVKPCKKWKERLSSYLTSLLPDLKEDLKVRVKGKNVCSKESWSKLWEDWFDGTVTKEEKGKFVITFDTLHRTDSEGKKTPYAATFDATQFRII